VQAAKHPLLNLKLTLCSLGLSATSQQYFSQNKPATSNQSAVLFSQNKPAQAISHQPPAKRTISV
jgi:hypothetical protein